FTTPENPTRANNRTRIVGFLETQKPGKALALPGQAKTDLLQFSLSASFFKLLLGSFSVSFAQTFFNWLRCTVNQVLGFFQAQASDFTHSFNDANFVCADFSQYEGELCLLFSSGSAGSRSSNSHSGGSSRHAKFFFHVRDQLGQFEHGHASYSV